MLKTLLLQSISLDEARPEPLLHHRQLLPAHHRRPARGPRRLREAQEDEAEAI